MQIRPGVQVKSMKTLMAVVSAVVLSLVAILGLQPVPHAQAITSVGGTIEIKKIISPSDTTTWNFGIDFSYTFFQTNQTDGYDSGPIAVPAGSHTVLEQTGYGTDGTPYFSTVECKDGVTVVATGGPASLRYGDNLISSGFNVAEGQNIVCTFSNTKAGTIEIKKVISPSDTTNWNLGIDASYTFFAQGKTDGYDSGQINVIPGGHNVFEQVGYNDYGFTDGTRYFSTVECKDGDTVVATGGPASLPYGNNLVSSGFNVASNQHIICTFSNTKAGTIEIKKVISPSDTTNWNLGIDASYTFFAQGKTDGYDSGQINVIPGGHNVFEQVGYNDYGFTDGTRYFSTVECKDGDTVVATGGPASLPYGNNLVSSGFNVASNQHIICTFTNTRAQLTGLSPAQMWIGVKNSNDVGTNFDLKAEVFKNTVLIGSGQVANVSGGPGFGHAVNRSIGLALTSGSTTFGSGDKLSFRLSVRIAAAGQHSGTARLWFNDTQANSLFDAKINGTDTNYYLRDGFVLGTSPAPVTSTSKKTIAVFADRLVGGNPWKSFGTWVQP